MLLTSLNFEDEKHLTRDSCLCDACYRHVDRKSNTPSYNNKSSSKRGSLVAPGPRQNHCHVLGCGQISSNILRRKWIIKMRKSICKVVSVSTILYSVWLIFFWFCGQILKIEICLIIRHVTHANLVQIAFKNISVELISQMLVNHWIKFILRLFWIGLCVCGICAFK